MIPRTVGKYRFVERIGRGGMGTVYRAMDEALEREVAIKILNSEITEPETLKRFRAEALTLARLNHPGIATIYDLYQDRGELMMVMEFVHGETLQRLSERAGPMPLPQATSMCLLALDALAYAHRLGIVHRDLKPSNLMVTDTGVVKVMDFGIARIMGSEHLTSDGSMMGTPAYMAPEQVRSAEVDWRADLYSMGVVLYRLLTGRLPFEAETPIAIAQKQLYDPPTPLTLARPDLPLWCEAVLERALAKSPDRRFQTAEEFKAALAAATIPLASSSTGAVALGELPTVPMPTPVVLATPGTASADHLSSSPNPGLSTPHGTSPQALDSKGPRTVVISSGQFVAGIAVLSVLLVALVAVVLFAIRRPGATPPAAPPPSSDSVGAAPGSQPSFVPPPAAPVSPMHVAPAAGGAGPSQPARADEPVTAKRSATAGTVAADTAPRGDGKSRGKAAAVSEEGGGPAPPAADTPAPHADTPGQLSSAEASPAPAAVVAPVQIFDGLKLLVTDGKDATEEDARLHFADGRLILTAVGKTLVASFPLEDVASLSYSRSRRPRWRNADGTDGRLDISGGLFGFLKPDRNWFVIQTRTQTFIIRVENAQVASLRQTSARLTGMAVYDFTDR
jgi:serine/threonine-protein kinase